MHGLDRPDVAATDARAGLAAEGVKADVVVRAGDEAAVLGKPQQLAHSREVSASGFSQTTCATAAPITRPTPTRVGEDEPMERKLAVVPGSAGGIGGAVATAFAGAGAELVGLEREQADLTQPEEVAAFFGGLDRLDVLFNGAAGAALYLATADFVTGTVLNVDAGWTL